MEFDKLSQQQQIEYIRKASELLERGYSPPILGDWSPTYYNIQRLARQMYESQKQKSINNK
jgi:hypothetical protein